MRGISTSRLATDREIPRYSSENSIASWCFVFILSVLTCTPTYLLSVESRRHIESEGYKHLPMNRTSNKSGWQHLASAVAGLAIPVPFLPGR
ncbi:hypothetical protein M404DRAFT_999957 [Pisolithus tinctorius Marx 270]|uniref:Uncharacterized protein n=1 Tax=Pisolithus tinctorius Marx 270 TaxID=870435 RepID=A0A0C3J8K1_PISTI|nr:hypothetical protein M404DRAFT_999957 [Pisolithus tinctorius Marx 270]